MARQDELNPLASIKGVPSAAKETTDERYTALNDIDKVEMKVVSDGTVPAYIGTLLSHAQTNCWTAASQAPMTQSRRSSPAAQSPRRARIESRINKGRHLASTCLFASPADILRLLLFHCLLI